MMRPFLTSQWADGTRHTDEPERSLVSKIAFAGRSNALLLRRAQRRARALFTVSRCGFQANELLHGGFDRFIAGNVERQIAKDRWPDWAPRLLVPLDL